eukprot:jgi/Astpho2/5012/Aster-05946
MGRLAACTLVLLYAASGVASSQLSTAKGLIERSYDRAEGCQASSSPQRIACGKSAATRAQCSLHEPARHLLQSTETLLGAAEEAPASLGSLLAAGSPAAPVNASSRAQIEEAGASSGSSTALAEEPATAAILQGVPTGGAPEQAPASAPEQAVLAPAEAPPQLVLLPVDNLQTPAVRAAAAAAAAAEEAAAALGPASVAETEELASNPVERSLPQVLNSSPPPPPAQPLPPPPPPPPRPAAPPAPVELPAASSNPAPAAAPYPASHLAPGPQIPATQSLEGFGGAPAQLSPQYSAAAPSPASAPAACFDGPLVSATAALCSTTASAFSLPAFKAAVAAFLASSGASFGQVLVNTTRPQVQLSDCQTGTQNVQVQIEAAGPAVLVPALPSTPTQPTTAGRKLLRSSTVDGRWGTAEATGDSLLADLFRPRRRVVGFGRKMLQVSGTTSTAPPQSSGSPPQGACSALLVQWYVEAASPAAALLVGQLLRDGAQGLLQQLQSQMDAAVSCLRYAAAPGSGASLPGAPGSRNRSAPGTLGVDDLGSVPFTTPAPTTTNAAPGGPLGVLGVGGQQTQSSSSGSGTSLQPWIIVLIVVLGLLGLLALLTLCFLWCFCCLCPSRRRQTRTRTRTTDELPRHGVLILQQGPQLQDSPSSRLSTESGSSTRSSPIKGGYKYQGPQLSEHSGSMRLGTQRIMASHEGFAEPSDMEAVTVASSGSSSVYMNPMGATSVEGNSREDRRKRRKFDVSAVQRKLDADLAAAAQRDADQQPHDSPGSPMLAVGPPPVTPGGRVQAWRNMSPHRSAGTSIFLNALYEQWAAAAEGMSPEAVDEMSDGEGGLL